MRDTVYLRLDRHAPDRLEWLTSDSVGAPARGSAEEASAACAGHHVVFFAPGESVLLVDARIPARNRQRLMQALPFMLEDRLAQDIELLHFSLGAREQDGTVNAAVVERAHLERWLNTLRAADIEPDHVCPETLALPLEPGAWTVLKDGDVTLVRTSRQGGFALDTDNLAIVLPRSLDAAEEEDRPERIQIYDAAPGTDNGFAATIDADVVIRPLAGQQDGGALALMAQHFTPRDAIDLLQGEYNRREQLGRMYRPWLASAALAGLLLVLHTGLSIHDYLQFSRESARLQQEIVQTFQEAFPEERRVVNPRVQMERGLAALRGNGGGDPGGFLDVLRDAATPLTQVDGLILQRINYRDNRLDLAIAIRDLQHLDRLRRQLTEEAGLEVEIQSASALNDRVEARLQLRSGP